MIKSSFYVLTSAIFILFSLSDASSQISIPNINFGYPVRISLSDGTVGTGFYLDDDPFTYLVTAKHVLFKKNSPTPKAQRAELTSYGKDPNGLSPNILQLNLEDMFTANNLKIHPTHDVAIGRIGKVESQNDTKLLKLYKWVNSINWAKTGIVRVNIENNVKKFSEVFISNEVIVYGYPSFIGIKNIPQLDYNRPLLRKGIIAGINPTNNSIIIDAVFNSGNSGGPVFEVNGQGINANLQLVGLISEYIPYAEEWLDRQDKNSNVNLSNSGYAVVVPVDFILEILWD